MSRVEFIRKAAVKLDTDIFTGKNHSVCLRKMKSATTQGFIADSLEGPRFVNRKDALEIAIAAGQEINKHIPKDRLVSEDLEFDGRFMLNERTNP